MGSKVAKRLCWLETLTNRGRGRVRRRPVKPFKLAAFRGRHPPPPTPGRPRLHPQNPPGRWSPWAGWSSGRIPHICAVTLNPRDTAAAPPDANHSVPTARGEPPSWRCQLTDRILIPQIRRECSRPRRLRRPCLPERSDLRRLAWRRNRRGIVEGLVTVPGSKIKRKLKPSIPQPATFLNRSDSSGSGAWPREAGPR